ncbi:MAG: ATP-binding protein [Peptococcaceae bacterium]|nr:ATP-binding protein [Peptococcaceae bacterium]
MFIGRAKELDKLNKMHNSDRFEFAVIFGRRRVGKTTLIREFIKGKNSIFFVASESTALDNLASLSRCIGGGHNAPVYRDYESAFASIFSKAENEQLVFVIDEYPYLAESFRGISSVLQILIDHKKEHSKLMLILCGSSMSFMENQVLGYQSPLFGRRTAQFKIMPFSFFESLPFFGTFGKADKADKADKAVLYGITGGIPDYLAKLDPAKSVDDNIIDLFLTPSGHLFEEPSNLLKQELREPATYNVIIEAIASGASRLNEIATKCGIESNKCAKYLKSLMSLGIVKKELPITETSSKKSIYLLDDLMFRFWYRFVFPNMSGIVSGLGRAVYDHEVAENLSAYMGLVFEDICKQYMIEEAKKNALPFFTGRAGRWWGNNPNERRQEEIDILAYHKDSALFCECKWTNASVDSNILDDLEAKSSLFSYENKWFWLFAKTGFTDKLIHEAEKRGNVRLIKFEDML